MLILNYAHLLTTEQVAAPAAIEIALAGRSRATPSGVATFRPRRRAASFSSIGATSVAPERKPMRRNKLRLYLHLVWATWDRLPLITPDIERRLYRCIESEAQGRGCKVLALNGVADHVHLVVSFPTTITIADLVKQVKGVSSHFANEVLTPPTPFKWQGSYGAFTISRWDVDRIVQYVKCQKEHHAADSLWPEWEEVFEEVDPEGGD